MISCASSFSFASMFSKLVCVCSESRFRVPVINSLNLQYCSHGSISIVCVCEMGFVLDVVDATDEVDVEEMFEECGTVDFEFICRR